MDFDFNVKTAAESMAKYSVLSALMRKQEIRAMKLRLKVKLLNRLAEL